MNLFLLPFPTIDPVILSVGPLAIRWYGLAYAVGIWLAWVYVKNQLKRYPTIIPPRITDDLIVPLIVGIVIGGRLGYVLVYDPIHYIWAPFDIIKVWQGGMSFHGGLVGVLMAILWVARCQRLPILGLADVAALGAPIGIFLGRIANFINSEHIGRPTNVPWAVIFPIGDGIPRHPSQLYEAATEGLLLGIVLYFVWRRHRQLGYVTGVFLAGYGLMRFLMEFFRMPDAIVLDITIGQLLSLPMILAGLWLMRHAAHSTSH